MTTPASGTISFGNLRTEFNPAGSDASLAAYRIGGGFVANHENNANIPTSNTNLAMNKWYSSDVDFEAGSYVSGNTTTYYTTTGPVKAVYVGMSVLTPTFGTIGPINLVGTNKSSTAQTALVKLSHATYYIWSGGNWVSDGEIDVMAFSGNVVGTWWANMTTNGITSNRASSGTYDSIGNVTGFALSPPLSFVSGNTYSVQIVLT